MLVFDNTFQFITGSWADYTYFDKQKNELTRIYFSILERETIKNAPYIWMEIEAEMKDTPVVVTRVLVEETNAGPGKIDQAIVQVQGYSPFKVPKKYLEGQDQQVGEFKPAHIVKKLDSRKITQAGKTIDVLAVEAENDKGEKVTAMVSVQILPIALYEAETSDLKMTAVDWGGGARTKIEGEPIPFFLWIIEQAATALTKKK